MCIRYKNKDTASTGPCGHSEQERKAKAQEREKRKKTKHPQILVTFQGHPKTTPKDQAQGR